MQALVSPTLNNEASKGVGVWNLQPLPRPVLHPAVPAVLHNLDRVSSEHGPFALGTRCPVQHAAACKMPPHPQHGHPGSKIKLVACSREYSCLGALTACMWDVMPVQTRQYVIPPVCQLQACCMLAKHLSCLRSHGQCCSQAYMLQYCTHVYRRMHAAEWPACPEAEARVRLHDPLLVAEGQVHRAVKGFRPVLVVAVVVGVADGDALQAPSILNLLARLWGQV